MNPSENAQIDEETASFDKVGRPETTPNRAHDSAYLQDLSDSSSLSKRFQAHPRASLIEALAMAVAGAASSGDLEAARVASEALSKLLATSGGEAARVVDIRSLRAKKEEEQ